MDAPISAASSIAIAAAQPVKGYNWVILGR